MSRPVSGVRKPGARYPNGELKHPSAAERASIAERMEADRKSVVLTYRKRIYGFGLNAAELENDLAESALGRFCMRNRLRKEIYTAALEYAELRAKWTGAWDAPGDCGAPGESPSGSGEGPTSDTAQGWRLKLDAIDNAILLASGQYGLRATQRIVLAGLDLDDAWDEHVKKGLVALAIAIGTITAKDHPFQ